MTSASAAPSVTATMSTPVFAGIAGGLAGGGVFGRWAKTLAPAIGIGLICGVWWVLGALLIMPAWLGMTGMVYHLGATQWQGLIGHLICGLLLGGVYVAVRPRLHRS